MNIKNWINATLTPSRMVQGAIVLLFSGVHFAVCTAVGGFIALQHENPDPEMEARLYEIHHTLEQPLAGVLRSLSFLPDIFAWAAWMLNSLLWGLAAYLICYGVFAGLRGIWRWLVGAKKTSA